MTSLLKQILITQGEGGVKAELEPPAWSYMETVGQIWSQRQGAYFDREPGTGGLYVDQDPPTFRGGWYWDRT